MIKFLSGLMVGYSKLTSYVSKCSNDICQIIESEGVVYTLMNSLMHFETCGSSTEMVVEILIIYSFIAILICVTNVGIYIVCNADFEYPYSDFGP